MGECKNMTFEHSKISAGIFNKKWYLFQIIITKCVHVNIFNCYDNNLHRIISEVSIFNSYSELINA